MIRFKHDEAAAETDKSTFTAWMNRRMNTFDACEMIAITNELNQIPSPQEFKEEAYKLGYTR